MSPGETSLNYRPFLVRLAISAITTLILGLVAFYFYSSSICWDGTSTCSAYSPLKKWTSIVLAAPIFAMQEWLYGTVENVSNFDPVVIRRAGWLFLWIYYFALV